jgi:hypothetical protein
MKITDLRIGNWLFEHVGQEPPIRMKGKISEITNESVRFGSSNHKALEKVSEIPLNKGWLLNLGLVIDQDKNGVDFIIVTNTVFLLWAESHLVVAFKEPGSDQFIDLGLKPIHYVNQLQNWYYENTGEELT